MASCGFRRTRVEFALLAGPFLLWMGPGGNTGGFGGADVEQVVGRCLRAMYL